jgi:hypothetical protein
MRGSLQRLMATTGQLTHLPQWPDGGPLPQRFEKGFLVFLPSNVDDVHADMVRCI